jgi:hypothetical protein
MPLKHTKRSDYICVYHTKTGDKKKHVVRRRVLDRPEEGQKTLENMGTNKQVKE